MNKKNCKQLDQSKSQLKLLAHSQNKKQFWNRFLRERTISESETDGVQLLHAIKVQTVVRRKYLGHDLGSNFRVPTLIFKNYPKSIQIRTIIHTLKLCPWNQLKGMAKNSYAVEVLGAADEKLGNWRPQADKGPPGECCADEVDRPRRRGPNRPNGLKNIIKLETPKLSARHKAILSEAANSVKAT
jgi:hypothetical protein